MTGETSGVIGNITRNSFAVMTGVLLMSACSTENDRLGRNIAGSETGFQQQMPSAQARSVAPEVAKCTLAASIDPELHSDEAVQCAIDQNRIPEIVKFTHLPDDEVQEIVSLSNSALKNATGGVIHLDNAVVREPTKEEASMAAKKSCTNKSNMSTWLSSAIIEDGNNVPVALGDSYACFNDFFGVAMQQPKDQIDVLGVRHKDKQSTALTLAHELIHTEANVGHMGQLQNKFGEEPLFGKRYYSVIDLDEILKDTKYYEYLSSYENSIMGAVDLTNVSQATLAPVAKTILNNPKYFTETGTSLIKNLKNVGDNALLSADDIAKGAMCRIELLKHVPLIDGWLSITDHDNASVYMNSLVLLPISDKHAIIGFMDEHNNFAQLGEISLDKFHSTKVVSKGMTIELKASVEGTIQCSIAKG